MRARLVRTQAPEVSIGDLIADGVLLDIQAKSVSLQSSEVAQALDYIKNQVDKMATPVGYTKAGDMTERVVGDTTLFERQFDAKNGAKLTHMVRLTQSAVLIVDMLELSGLPNAWQGMGEHALLSIERGR